MRVIIFGDATANVLQGLEQVLSPWLTNGAALGTLFACSAYAVLVAGVRWYMISRPARKLLIARIDDDLAASVGRIDEDDAALIEAKNLLAKAKANLATGVWAAIGWSGADEVSGWRHVYAAERTLVSVWPADRVRVRLLEARDRLVEVLGVESVHLKLVQAMDDAENANPPDDARCRALLDEALGIVRDAEARKVESFCSWQNKTMLLVGMGLMLIAILAGTLGKPAFLLVGAVGGFLSRLSKVMRADEARSDDAAYWSAIFLSPLLGALAGWAGILLANLAGQLGLLGSSLQFLGWTSNWSNPGTLGFAFLFGLSEHYLNDMASNIETRTAPVEVRPSVGTAGSATASTGRIRAAGSTRVEPARGAQTTAGAPTNPASTDSGPNSVGASTPPAGAPSAPPVGPSDSGAQQNG